MGLDLFFSKKDEADFYSWKNAKYKNESDSQGKIQIVPKKPHP